MQVMAINSSMRRPNISITELMLNHLTDGMCEAGAEVTYVPLRKRKIKNCKGCYSCMTETPGQCKICDDMTKELLPIFLQSDIVIYATPLFHHTMNAPMKTFIERTFPACQPFFKQKKDGKWTNPLRFNYPRAVVLSVGGYLGSSAFEALSHYANFLWGKGLLAEIYRPSSEFMMQLPSDKQNDVLDAMRLAGTELVQFMKISPETMERITQPLDDIENLLRLHNLFWKACADDKVSPPKYFNRLVAQLLRLKMTTDE